MALPADDRRRHRALGMESALDPVVGAAFPVFALVGCGVLAGRFRIITPGSSEALNRFVYAFALPAMLFLAVYRGSPEELLGSGSFLAGVVLANRRGGIGRALAGVARSPLIWPIGLAMVCVFLRLTIPAPVERFASLLAAAAGPCALFAIGLFVSQLSIREGFRASWPTTVLKLVLHPLLMAALAFWLLPIDATWAKIAVVCASLPLGATAFVLAQRYRVLEAETSTDAVLSTAASVVTVSIVMTLLARS